MATQLKLYDSNPDWWGTQTASEVHTNVSIAAQGHSVIQSVSRSPSSQSFSQSVSQPVSATHVAARLLAHWLIHSQAHCNSHCNSHCLSLCHSHQSHGESASRPASQSVSQSVHQSANQSVKQSPTTTIIQSHAPRNATSLYVSLTPTRTVCHSAGNPFNLTNSLCHCAFTHSRSTSHGHSILRLAVSHASDATASHVAPSTYATLSFCALCPPLSCDCYLTSFPKYLARSHAHAKHLLSC